MGASKEEIKAIESRRYQVAALFLRKVSPERIAAQLDFDRATIYRDLIVLRQRWSADLADLEDVRLTEFAELREMEREAATHPADIGWAGLRLRYKERISKMLGLDYRELTPGSSPANPLYVAPGQIDWENLPEDLAERMLELDAEIRALQPASGGLIIDEEGRTV